MITLANPLSWPLMPVLPLLRRNASPFERANLGILLCDRDLTVPPVVYLVNLFDVGGRSVDAIRRDPAVPRESFPDLEQLGHAWFCD